jgi:arginyl-tRNA synthetase
VEGKAIVEEHLRDVFEKSDGAIIFPGEKYGLHTRVFINSQGLPTYEAKELGLNKKKFEVEPNLNLSLIVTANEIEEYFKVMIKAISRIFPDIAAKTKHIAHGVLKLPSGKMSSRTGNIISAETLIDEVKTKILEIAKDRVDADTIEMIAIGAIKYAILHQAIGGDIVFDMEKSVSFEGDSGPYLQYSTVRANSLLQKAEADLDTECPSGWKTTKFEKLIERFPEIIKRSAMEYAPHYIVTYLIELAGEFNSFYAGEKITNSPYRLALTQAFKNVMTIGLDLLGINVPKRM